MLVTQKRISWALSLVALFVASPSLAAPPSQNQATADTVAAVLSQNPALAASPLRIEVREGVVLLSGTVSSPALKAEALGRTQSVAGVRFVSDRINVVSDPRIRPAQFESVEGAPIANLASLGHGMGMGAGNGAGSMMGGAAGGPIMEGANMSAPGFDGPMPEGPAVPGANQASSPGYPNYAWPSYAPHPNFSAVGYPTVYPWQAWPNIGPFYPYPEVPLDWRAVTLRWDDGLWWLDFRKHYTRPFFTPYPFGLFAY